MRTSALTDAAFLPVLVKRKRAYQWSGSEAGTFFWYIDIRNIKIWLGHIV